MPSRLNPSSGIPFHSLHATSHALQPMQTLVSVKKPIRSAMVTVAFLRTGAAPVSRKATVTMAERMGFFTDTSVCIGCKACEVACKEWNGIPDDGFNLLGMSYDNTGGLNADTWRHVAFIEQPAATRPAPAAERPDFRWLMM